MMHRVIKESGADLIINFYEVLCGITCKLFRMGIPMVCVAHQYISFCIPTSRCLAGRSCPRAC